MVAETCSWAGGRAAFDSEEKNEHEAGEKQLGGDTFPGCSVRG